MKRLTLGLAFLLASAFAGCRSSTRYGECVGLDDDDRDPKLVYRLSTRNVVLAVVFVEMLFPPIVVALEDAYCPVGVRGAGGGQ